MNKIKYNIWVSIERVTITNDDEIYEDEESVLPVKYACVSELEEAVDILGYLEDDSIRYMCNNCGGGFHKADMVFDETGEGEDLCEDCSI